MEIAKEADAALAAAVTASPRQSDADIASVRAGGERLAALDAALATLEVMASSLSKQREKLSMEDLPTRMMELRIPSVGLPEVTPEQWLRDGAAELARAARILSGESNDEADRALREAILDGIKTPDEVVLRLEDWAHANIASDWDPERREAAFKWLVDNGCEGMLQTVVQVKFARGEKQMAEKAVALLQESFVDRVSVTDGVPWSTLSAFVREEVFDKNNSELPLELLGARVGKRARLAKERKKRR